MPAMPRLPTRFALAASLSTVFALAACGGDDVTAVARSDAQTPSGGTPTTPAPTPAATVTPQPGKWKAARGRPDRRDARRSIRRKARSATTRSITSSAATNCSPTRNSTTSARTRASAVSRRAARRRCAASYVYDDRRERPRPRGAEPGRDRPERRCAVPDRRPPRPVDHYETPDGGPALHVHVVVSDNLSDYRATRSGSRCRAAAICASRTEKASRSRPRNCRPA